MQIARRSAFRRWSWTRRVGEPAILHSRLKIVLVGRVWGVACILRPLESASTADHVHTERRGRVRPKGVTMLGVDCAACCTADHRGRGNAAVVSGMWLNGFIVCDFALKRVFAWSPGSPGSCRARVGLSAHGLERLWGGRGRRRGVLDFDDGHS